MPGEVGRIDDDRVGEFTGTQFGPLVEASEDLKTAGVRKASKTAAAASSHSGLSLDFTSLPSRGANRGRAERYESGESNSAVDSKITSWQRVCSPLKLAHFGLIIKITSFRRQ